MKVYTSHTKTGADPVLVPEAASLWAATFGWLWLVYQGAWLPAVLLITGEFLVGRLCVAIGSPAPGLGLLLVQGLFGWDMVRFSLARRGYAEGPVVSGVDYDAAFVRLLDQPPEHLAGMTRTTA